MSGKHTPAPWFISGDLVYALDEDERVNRFSARIDGGYAIHSWRKSAADVRTSPEELDANARLISAAPEMLEALHQALAVINGVMNEFGTAPAWELAAQEISAAIAKAEGQS